MRFLRDVWADGDHWVWHVVFFLALCGMGGAGLACVPAGGEPVVGEVDGGRVRRPAPPTATTTAPPFARGYGWQAARAAVPAQGKVTQPTGQIRWAGRAKVTSYGDRWEHEVPWDCEGRPLRVGVCAANPEIALDTILWVQGIPRCVRVRDRGGKVKLGYTSSSENANLDIYTLRPVGTRRGVPWAPVQPPHRRRAHDAGRCAPGRALPAP